MGIIVSLFAAPISIFPGAGVVVDDLEEPLPGVGGRPHPPALADAVHTHPHLQLSGMEEVNVRKYRDVIEDVYLDNDLSVSTTLVDKHLNMD